MHVQHAGNLDTGEVGAYEPVDYVEGIEDPSEFPNLIRWLVGHGYTDEQIVAVASRKFAKTASRQEAARPS